MIPVCERLIAAGAPFEIVERFAGGRTFKAYRHSPENLRAWVARARRHGARPALRFQGALHSYDQLFRRADALSSTFARLAAGTRIGLCMENGPRWAVAFAAAVECSLVPVLLDPRASTEALADALKISSCLLVVADSAQCALRVDERFCVVILGPDDQLEIRGVFPAARDPSEGDRKIDPADIALVAFTSGSTGKKKGVASSHRSLMTGLYNMMLGGAICSAQAGPGTRRSTGTPQSIVVAPLWHVSGYAHLLLMWAIGGTVTLMKEWNVDECYGELSHAPIQTIIGAHAAMMRELVRTQPGRLATSSVTSLAVHGTSYPVALMEEFRDSVPGVNVVTGYGLTESNGSISVIGGAELVRRPGSCGQPLPTVELALRDRSGRESRCGEIWIRGAMLMEGYLGSAEEGRGLDQGWFRTHDLGEVDEDGFLHVKTRLSAVGSFEAASVASEIETALGEVSSLDDVVVIVGQAILTDRITIYLQLRPAAPETAVLTQVRDRLQRLGRADVDLKTCAFIPRTRTGKVDITALHPVRTVAETS